MLSDAEMEAACGLSACSLTRSCFSFSFSMWWSCHCSATYSMKRCPFTRKACSCSCSQSSTRPFSSSSSCNERQVASAKLHNQGAKQRAGWLGLLPQSLPRAERATCLWKSLLKFRSQLLLFQKVTPSVGEAAGVRRLPLKREKLGNGQASCAWEATLGWPSAASHLAQHQTSGHLCGFWLYLKLLEEAPVLLPLVDGFKQLLMPFVALL